MTIQVCVDESAAGTANDEHFVMAALISESETWDIFSDKWVSCLREPPVKLKTFKYANFVKRLNPKKTKKLKQLSEIINDYAKLVAPVVIHYPSHKAKIGALNNKDTRHPYFLAAHFIVEKVARKLWDIGLRERFEIIFDRQDIFFPRFTKHYPGYLDMLEETGAEYRSILPIMPISRDDTDFLPLQAADLFAGLYRERADNIENMPYDWLVENFPNLELVPGMNYVDKANIDKICEPLENAKLDEI